MTYNIPYTPSGVTHNMQRDTTGMMLVVGYSRNTMHKKSICQALRSLGRGVQDLLVAPFVLPICCSIRIMIAIIYPAPAPSAARAFAL